MAEETAQPWNDRFSAVSCRGLAALLSLPHSGGTGTASRWPLILFLHGRGECGNDLALLTRHGIPRVVARTSSLEFATLSPQVSVGSDWSEHRSQILALLDVVIERQAVDPQRIYLTGISMGGRGAWHLAIENPGRFAAIAPVCGRVPDIPDFFKRLAVLRNVPIWMFHGARDPIIPVSESDTIAAALRMLGANVLYTVYPDADHDSWTRTYDNPELYAWFLSHHR